MNAIGLVGVAAVAATGSAIWLRRHTFASRVERPLTLSVIFCIVGIALVAPQSVNVIDDIAHRLTGIWHLGAVVGYICLIVSQACALSALLGSLFTDAERGTWLRFWVQPAVTLVIPAMAGCVVATHALRDYSANVMAATPDGWLIGFWVLGSTTCIYLWLAGLRVLWIIRADRQSRPIAHAYMAAMSCGITGGALLALWMVTGAEPLLLATWCLVCIAYGGTCLTAAWSWRLKERRLRGDRARARQRRAPDPAN